MKNKLNQRSQFSFDLPSDLIAHYPLVERSASRLLCLERAPCADQDKANFTQVMPWRHRYFSALPSLLAPNDLMVFNDTRVIPARLYAQKKESGGAVEILIEQLIDGNKAWVKLNTSRPSRIGSELQLLDRPSPLGKPLSGIAVISEHQGSRYLLSFQHPLAEVLKTIGHMPLPPYIKRETEQFDSARYQTIYAKHDGAIAAPTAGLHFDDILFGALSERGVEMAYVTLHVGAGTFQPVREKDIDRHDMHEEHFSLSHDTCEKIRATKERGGRVVAIGTTTVRVLESVAQNSDDGLLKPWKGKTNLFIRPGYRFQVVDAMLTNFHLPCSTLIMLVCAFAGYKNTLAAYRDAVEHRYRFFSYGDAMFIAHK